MENKIDSYKIFESVARNESISKASEELFISQPAVSQSIKRLEELIGGELFTRTKFGVRLNTEGKIFYETDKITSSLSDRISADLQKRGMKFVGSTIIYSYLQAIGMIYSHEKDCFLHKESK